jgi:urea transporter
VLLGLLISQHFAWSAVLPPLILACGGLSAILTRQWLKRATQPSDLPAYTAPFVGLGWLLLGTVPERAFALNVPDASAIFTAPFTGLAQIMLLDQPVAGALIALGLWLANRRAATWALIGASVGVLIALWLDEPATALLGLHSYNPALGREQPRQASQQRAAEQGRRADQDRQQAQQATQRLALQEDLAEAVKQGFGPVGTGWVLHECSP